MDDDQDFNDLVIQLLRQKRQPAPSRDYVRFDEIEDVLTSTDLLVDVLARFPTTPVYWKWAIIAAHSALQGAMVCALDDATGIAVMDKDTVKAILKWQNEPNAKYPEEEKLAYFPTILERFHQLVQKEGRPISEQPIRDIEKLHHEFRNKFIHYTPGSWLIEKAGLPRIIGAALDVVELAMNQGEVLVKLSGNRKRRLKRNLEAARSELSRVM